MGRTRTAPDVPGEVHALRFALVSCSNYTGGYFTAYRAIAQRDDLDLVLHVGDYIYEYGNGAGRYGPPALVGVRDGQPDTETIDLEGYRLRHALHKADPDAQEAHRALPWITIFDDHEVANNAWANGAENHQADEGAYLARRADAMKAYLEWMPFRMPDQSVPHQGTRFFKRFTFGALGDLSILETRQNRSQQVSVPGVPFDGFVPIGVNAGDRRRDRLTGAPPARAGADDLALGRCGPAGQAVAPARQPGDGGAGAATRVPPSAHRASPSSTATSGTATPPTGRACSGTSRPSPPRPVTSWC